MKVVISAGGTGGHINPAIAIGKYILEENENNEVLFIGSDGALEKKLYPLCGGEYRLFKAKGLNRKKPLKNFSILYDDYKAYKDILKEVEKFKPDIGISCGGYISFMAMKAVQRLKKPYVITEQNAYPGLTNRLLSKNAEKYCLAFEKAKDFLKNPEKCIVTGNPVRKEFVNYNKAQLREKLGFPEDKKIVLCFGGSLGAQKLNEAFTQLAQKTQNDESIVYYIGTGSRYLQRVSEKIGNNKNVIIKEYIDNMPEVLCACDLAITRAGAMTVSEICASKTPSVLIPSPNVTADHQTKNALVISSKNGGVMIRENDLTAELLLETVRELTDNPYRLKEMEKNLVPLAVTDSAKRIYDVLKSITG